MSSLLKTPGRTRRGTLAAAGGLLAAACGAPAGGKAPAPRQAPVAITYWKSLVGPRHDAQVKLTDDFNASQDAVRVTLEHVGEYNPAAEKLRVALASGAGVPDTMMLSVNADLPYFARAGVLRSLDDLARRDASLRLDGLFPGFVEDGRIGGTLYQLPFARSTPLLYLNLDLLRAAGLSERAPDTWAELLEMGRQVLRARPPEGSTAEAGASGGPGIAAVPRGSAYAALGLTTSYWEIESLLWAFGGSFSDASLSVKASAAETVRALQWAADLIHRHRVAVATKNAQTEFVQGSRAFLVGSTASLTQILDGAQFRVGAGLMPSMPAPEGNGTRAVPGGGAGLSILGPVGRAQQEAGWEFLKFVTSVRSTAYFAQATGYTPVRREAADLPELRRFLERYPAARVALEQLAHVRATDAILGTPFANLRLEELLGRVFFDGASVLQACQQAAAELRRGAGQPQ